MPLVTDASITSCWAFADESDTRADAALARMEADEALVPSIWWFEVRNTLLVNERRQRISPASTAEFLRFLARLSVRVDHAPDEEQLLRLARKFRLTSYDASYLELAQRAQAPLATLDAALARAAIRSHVPLLEA